MQEFITPEIAAAFAPTYYWTTQAAPNCEVELLRRVFFYQIFKPFIHTSSFASAGGRVLVLQFLFSLGTMLDHVDYVTAAKHGCMKTLRWMLQVNQVKVLVAICREGNMGAVREFQREAVNMRVDDDLPLRWAARHNRVDVIQFLVETCGANVRASQEECIRVACDNEYIPLARYLVAHGADVRVLEDRILGKALFFHRIRTLEFLLETVPALAVERSNWITRAFEECNNRKMMRVLTRAMDLNIAFRLSCKVSRLKFIRTLPHDRVDDECMVIAATHGHLELMQYLVQEGGNPRANGDAPMAAAKWRGHINMIRYLASLGAPLSRQWRETIAQICKSSSHLK